MARWRNTFSHCFSDSSLCHRNVVIIVHWRNMRRLISLWSSSMAELFVFSPCWKSWPGQQFDLLLDSLYLWWFFNYWASHLPCSQAFVFQCWRLQRDCHGSSSGRSRKVGMFFRTVGIFIRRSSISAAPLMKTKMLKPCAPFSLSRWS